MKWNRTATAVHQTVYQNRLSIHDFPKARIFPVWDERRMDEITLIQAARNGDLEAFNRLVLAYQDLVYNQALRLLGSPETAQDFSQDAFLTAYRNLKTFRGGSFRAWLLRIVTYACYDELRRWKRRPTVALNPLDSDDEEVESPTWLADTAPSPEDRAEQSDLRQALQQYLDELPMEYRSVVVLVDGQGLDYAEAAEVLEVPLGTVKSRLARARVRLRERIQGTSNSSGGYSFGKSQSLDYYL